MIDLIYSFFTVSLRWFHKKLWINLRIIRAIFVKDFKISKKPFKTSENKFLIELSDDLKYGRVHLKYLGWNLERDLSPPLSLFRDSEPFRNAGIPNPDVHVIEFRGVKIFWIEKLGVCGPTLDSYILTASLVDSWNSSVKRVWDVGCGTGIIGLHLLRLTTCRDMDMTDVDPRAIEHTRINAEQLGLSNLNLKIEIFPPTKQPKLIYDLLVCNPPYFPPGFLSISEFEVKVTDNYSLTKSIMNVGPKWANWVVFSFSSVMLKEVLGDLQNLNFSGKKWSFLRKERLPLTAGNLHNYSKLPSGVFTSGPNRRFDLWHDVYVCEI